MYTCVLAAVRLITLTRLIPKRIRGIFRPLAHRSELPTRQAAGDLLAALNLLRSQMFTGVFVRRPNAQPPLLFRIVSAPTTRTPLRQRLTWAAYSLAMERTSSK